MNNNGRTTTKPAREAESARRQAAIDRMIAAKLQAIINKVTISIREMGTQ